MYVVDSIETEIQEERREEEGSKWENTGKDILP